MKCILLKTIRWSITFIITIPSRGFNRKIFPKIIDFHRLFLVGFFQLVFVNSMRDPTVGDYSFHLDNQ